MKPSRPLMEDSGEEVAQTKQGIECNRCPAALAGAGRKIAMLSCMATIWKRCCKVMNES
jgi:hypothetical protein